MEPVLTKYRHVFHEESSHDFPGTNLVEHRIVTGDTRPLRKSPYRVTFTLRKEIENPVQEMLRKGVIEESTSPWNFPAILVPRKSQDGTPRFRFCVDIRALNAMTVRLLHPSTVRRISIDVHGSKYFTVLDYYSGFWQIKIAEEDKLKTAFSTRSGHYHFQTPIRAIK
jgi:hypothetical protein